MSTSPFLPAEDPRAGSCGSCGAPMETDQRYCLSCGARRQHARLPFQDGGPSAPVPQVGVTPALWAPPGGTSSGPQTSTLLAALACVLIAFGVGVLVGDDGGGSQQPIVLGGAPAASAAAPVPTTTTEATASAEESAAEEVDASSEKTEKIDKAGLNAAEKQEATELEKTPAKVPDAVVLDDEAKKDLSSDDPDKAREASQALPDSVSTGGE